MNILYYQIIICFNIRYTDIGFPLWESFSVGQCFPLRPLLAQVITISISVKSSMLEDTTNFSTSVAVEDELNLF